MSKKYKKVDVVAASIIINLSQTSLPDILSDYQIVFLDNFFLPSPQPNQQQTRFISFSRVRVRLQVFLPSSSADIPKMTATGYNNQVTMSTATRDHYQGVSNSALDRTQDVPFIQPLNNGFIDAAAVSQAVHELNQKLAFVQVANTANETDYQAKIPEQRVQEVHEPFVVSNALEQNGQTTSEIQDVTLPAAKTETLELINPITAKVRHNSVTVTPAMEAYANDAVTLPINGTTDPDTTWSQDRSYHSTDSMTSATRLKRRLLETDGVYDGFSARIALSVGFSALYMVLRFRFSSLTSQKHKRRSKLIEI